MNELMLADSSQRKKSDSKKLLTNCVRLGETGEEEWNIKIIFW